VKILEPVAELPPKRLSYHSRHTRYGDTLKRALSLNGLILPVEFNNLQEAKSFYGTCRNRGGIGAKLGLTAVIRGNTVYVFRKGSP